MNSSNINKLFNISVLCLLLTILHFCPRSTVACTSCADGGCPGSAEKTLSLLQRFKEFNNDVTNKTVIIRLGVFALSATENGVNFIEIPDKNYNLNCTDPVNGTRIVSLVSVASPELIVTWRPVDIGSGNSGDNDVPIMYELKTENITEVFSVMSSNTTDLNWRFQLDYTGYFNTLINAKILTEDGDLAVTYHSDDKNTTLQSIISGISYRTVHQRFPMCTDCREYQ